MREALPLALSAVFSLVNGFGFEEAFKRSALVVECAGVWHRSPANPEGNMKGSNSHDTREAWLRAASNAARAVECAG
jgi:hypothetical protein